MDFLLSVTAADVIPRLRQQKHQKQNLDLKVKIKIILHTCNECHSICKFSCQEKLTIMCSAVAINIYTSVIYIDEHATSG